MKMKQIIESVIHFLATRKWVGWSYLATFLGLLGLWTLIGINIVIFHKLESKYPFLSNYQWLVFPPVQILLLMAIVAILVFILVNLPEEKVIKLFKIKIFQKEWHFDTIETRVQNKKGEELGTLKLVKIIALREVIWGICLEHINFWFQVENRDDAKAEELLFDPWKRDAAISLERDPVIIFNNTELHIPGTIASQIADFLSGQLVLEQE